MRGAVDGGEPLQFRATRPRRNGAEELQGIGAAGERDEHGLESTRRAHRRLVAQHAVQLIHEQAKRLQCRISHGSRTRMVVTGAESALVANRTMNDCIADAQPRESGRFLSEE